jgi:2-polyprenyl-3-methyl-5-hydroxy-6-metoxy-1,4-benzoquinol methylase
MPGVAIWDFWALRYERLYAQHFALGPSRRLVLDHLRARGVQPERILDLGCGVGQLARELATSYPTAHITAIDPSPGMIVRAQRAYAHATIEYHCGTVDDILPDERFDLIVSTHAFPYITHQADAMQRCHDLLLPGGRLLIVQGNTENLYDRLFYLFVKLTVSTSAYLSTRTLTTMMTAVGFTYGAITPLPRARFIPSIHLVEGIRHSMRDGKHMQAKEHHMLCITSRPVRT